MVSIEKIKKHIVYMFQDLAFEVAAYACTWNVESPAALISHGVKTHALKSFRKLQRCEDPMAMEHHIAKSAALNAIWLANGLEAVGITNEQWMKAAGIPFPKDDEIIFGREGIRAIKFKPESLKAQL